MSFSFGNISKRNYDYLISDDFKFTGTVFAGGTSYTGADIKIVLTLNRQFDEETKRLGEETAAKQEELQNFADSEYKEHQYYTRVLNDPSHSFKEGTWERRAVEKKIASTLDNYNNSKDAAEALNHVKHNSSDSNVPVTKVLAEAQTLSVSVFRDKAPVRSLGSVYPKGYTRGPRQIGGSIVFTVFDRDVLYEFLDAHPSDFDGNRNSPAVLDQLPPVDIIVSFANELGSVSRMAVYGVEFMNQGQIMSIEDMMTENTVEYVARDFDPMASVGIVDLQKSAGNTKIWQSKSASDLIFEEEYQDVKNSLDPFERFKRRSTRFL